MEVDFENDRGGLIWFSIAGIGFRDFQDCVQISFEGFFGGPSFVNPSKLICTPNILGFLNISIGYEDIWHFYFLITRVDLENVCDGSFGFLITGTGFWKHAGRFLGFLDTGFDFLGIWREFFLSIMGFHYANI